LLAETAIAALKPIQEQYAAITQEPGYLDSVLHQGREKAEAIANKTLTRVKKALGYSLPV
jgi:tryptophanyl-tRNA synthetase